ncbi:unnamed protein product [Protopolystoma xenopodis]|uniref:Uncharacterized protein n=1 Tax=Protopolystoma xenopodis TaxID=117903 RepID=A0A448WH28_9PLAT|nr:unnamed protein product [Protopolystoma xenopodis]
MSCINQLCCCCGKRGSETPAEVNKKNMSPENSHQKDEDSDGCTDPKLDVKCELAVVEPIDLESEEERRKETEERNEETEELDYASKEDTDGMNDYVVVQGWSVVEGKEEPILVQARVPNKSILRGSSSLDALSSMEPRAADGHDRWMTETVQTGSTDEEDWTMTHSAAGCRQQKRNSLSEPPKGQRRVSYRDSYEVADVNALDRRILARSLLIAKVNEMQQSLPELPQCLSDKQGVVGTTEASALAKLTGPTGSSSTHTPSSVDEDGVIIIIETKSSQKGTE